MATSYCLIAIWHTDNRRENQSCQHILFLCPYFFVADPDEWFFSFPGSHGKMLSQFSRHLDELSIVRLHPIRTRRNIPQRSCRREIVLRDNKTKVPYDRFFQNVVKGTRQGAVCPFPTTNLPVKYFFRICPASSVIQRSSPTFRMRQRL